MANDGVTANSYSKYIVWHVYTAGKVVSQSYMHSLKPTYTPLFVDVCVCLWRKESQTGMYPVRLPTLGSSATTAGTDELVARLRTGSVLTWCEKYDWEVRGADTITRCAAMMNVEMVKVESLFLGG